MTPDSPDPLIGSSIGSYQVVRKLGEGGMGAVYEILHPGIGKRLALKLLHAQFGRQPEIVRRFFDEARAVNLIGHPNIVDILDFNELPDGRPYLTMEYLEGEDLTERMARTTQMAPVDVLEILLPVCSALSAAHSSGITHRDLKPDNLFIERRGHGERVVVLDFGIAKLSPDVAASGPTVTGTLLGTPAYMAPEQATGQTSAVGPWTDVYALGCIAYHMFAGQPPFNADSLAALISMQAYETPAPLSAHRADLAGPWSDAVMHALAKDPGQRYADAGSFAAAIERANRAPQPHAAPTMMAMDAPSYGGSASSGATPMPAVTMTARSIASGAQAAPAARHSMATPPQPFASVPIGGSGGTGGAAVATPTRWVIPALSIVMVLASFVAAYLILTL